MTLYCLCLLGVAHPISYTKVSGLDCAFSIPHCIVYPHPRGLDHHCRTLTGQTNCNRSELLTWIHLQRGGPVLSKLKPRMSVSLQTLGPLPRKTLWESGSPWLIKAWGLHRAFEEVLTPAPCPSSLKMTLGSIL